MRSWGIDCDKKTRIGSGGLKRFIRYLYEYGQGKRLRNVGFVKAEQGDRDCTLHIHGKGLHMKGERQLALYLFYEENGECIGIYQGTVDNVNPAINYRLYYTNEDVAVPDNFLKINGIILESDTGRRYAAVWNDSPADVGHMRILRPEETLAGQREVLMPGEEAGPMPEAVPEEEALEEERPMPEDMISEEEPEQRVEEEQPMPEEETSWGAKALPEGGIVQRTDTLQGVNAVQEASEVPEANGVQEASEVPEANAVQKANIVQRADEMPERNAAPEDEAVPEADMQVQNEECIKGGRQDPGTRFCCTKIQRNDMARLPRCEWKWANNSFLLHGYYNYHHLALINEGEKFWLGVPGIYHPQEAKAASTFGFTEFIPYDDIRMDLTDDEKSNQEQFGYWCRQVKRPLKM